MIDLYTWSTPNGRKVSIMLEECGLPYRVHTINIGQGRPVHARVPRDQPEQQDPVDRRSRGPDGKPIAMMESGAILIYLADKTGKFFPQTTAQVRGRCSG